MSAVLLLVDYVPPLYSSLSSSHSTTPAEVNNPNESTGDQVAQGLAAIRQHDYVQAMQSLKKAAAQDSAEAENEIGYMYESAWGVPQDYEQAMQWYQMSAAQGYAMAETNVGYYYENGRGGVTKDFDQALQWYQKAAAQGFPMAQNDIGYYYEKGWGGVPQDYDQALQWYHKAAAQGNTKAEINIGEMYQYGRGVRQDAAQAMQWFKKAEAQGDTNAKKAIDELSVKRRPLADQPAPAPSNMQTKSSVTVQSGEPNMSCGQEYSPNWDSCVGSTKYSNGNTYVGEFHHGMREGFGVIFINAKGVSNRRDILSQEPSVYAGQFRGNKLNGHGVWFTKSGAGYSGTFIDNIPQRDVSQRNCSGKQSSSWSNCVAATADGSGNTYSGEFMRGQKQGVGMLDIRATGASGETGMGLPAHGVYVGEFAADRLNGPGLVFMPGAGFYGTFKNNVLTGPTS